MKKGIIGVGLLLIVLLSSCTLRFLAFIRNYTNQVAQLDVYVPDSSYYGNRPQSFGMAHEPVRFKAGFIKRFDDSIPMHWVDSAHFTVAIPPQTTVNLENVMGPFYNARSRADVKAWITVGQQSDTLMNGRRDFRQAAFKSTRAGFINGMLVLYHDIR